MSLPSHSAQSITTSFTCVEMKKTGGPNNRSNRFPLRKNYGKKIRRSQGRKNSIKLRKSIAVIAPDETKISSK
jgi:hypothetical protein